MDEIENTKVLMVVESFATGVYAVIKDIACNLDPDKFALHIIYSLREESPQNYKEDFNFPHITLTYLPMGHTSDYVRAIHTLRQIIRKERPDVIHLHSSKAGFIGRIAAHKASGRVLYTPHGISFIRTDVGRLKKMIFFLLEKVAQWYTPTRIIAVSEAERENALKLTSNAVTINNFIDVTAIPQKPHKRNTFAVGITGRISEAKNPVLFNRIARVLPDTPFIWIGDGPLRDRLTASNITVTGQVTRSEALKSLHGLSVYIQTSDWEGMPISLLEAMACSLPSIVSDIPAHRNLIVDGQTGIICPRDDEEAFAAEIRNLKQHEPMRNDLGKSACEYVMKYHDVRGAMKLYAGEYQRQL